MLDWLLKKENKSTLRVIAILMVFTPLAFAIGIGSKGEVVYEGVYPTFKWVTEWFRGWFEAIMMLSFILGLILLIPAFSQRRDIKEDE